MVLHDPGDALGHMGADQPRRVLAVVARGGLAGGAHPRLGRDAVAAGQVPDIVEQGRQHEIVVGAGRARQCRALQRVRELADRLAVRPGAVGREQRVNGKAGRRHRAPRITRSRTALEHASMPVTTTRIIRMMKATSSQLLRRIRSAS